MPFMCNNPLFSLNLPTSSVVQYSELSSVDIDEFVLIDVIDIVELCFNIFFCFSGLTLLFIQHLIYLHLENR